MGKVWRHLFALLFSAFALAAISTQLPRSHAIQATERGSFLFSFRGVGADRTVSIQIATEPPTIRALVVGADLVLENEEWKGEISVSSTKRSYARANVTYYEGGQPSYWRFELLVRGWYVQFDIDYLNKTTGERTHVKKYLVSEYVDGLDSGEYNRIAQETEEVAPPVSDYTVGRIYIVNKETSIVDDTFTYDSSEDVYVQEIDVDVLLDILIETPIPVTTTTVTETITMPTTSRVTTTIAAPTTTTTTYTATTTLAPSGLPTDMLLQITALSVAIATPLLAAFFTLRRRSRFRVLMRDMEEIFRDYKSDISKCEVALMLIRDKAQKLVEEGQLKPDQFALLENRIREYLEEVRGE